MCLFWLSILKISLILRSTHDFAILVITNDTANIIHESPFVKYFDKKIQLINIGIGQLSSKRLKIKQQQKINFLIF